MSTVDTMANPTAQYEACQKDVAASKGSADFDPADFLHVAKVARLAHVKAELTKLIHPRSLRRWFCRLNPSKKLRH